MLEGLSKIKWSDLEHAYGSARTVPKMLRNLLHTSPEVRADAQYHLSSALFHQGSIYSSTLKAIPFLIDLSVDQTTPERDQILFFLGSIADYCLCERGEVGEQYGAILSEAYESIQRGVKDFIGQLRDNDPAVRAATSYVITRFGKLSPETEAVYLEQLQAETDTTVQASFVANTYPFEIKSEHVLTALQNLLANRDLALVELVSAMVLVKSDARDVYPACLTVLLEALKNRRKLTKEYKLLYIRRSDFLYDVLSCLMLLKEMYSDKIFEASFVLLNDTSASRAITVVHTLLSLMFELPSNGNTISALSEEQRMVLRAIGQSDRAWIYNGSTIALLQEFGLPSQRSELLDI